MSNKKQLGIFFGNNTLSVIEVERQKVLNAFDAPHSLFDQNQQLAGNLPETIKLTAILQKALRDNHIEATNACLSLPTRDIILRSFSIPWMAASEIRGVVDFESRRYIPFKIDDLIYSFHSSLTAEKSKKRLRILFVAIKKDALEWYRNILDQAGLKTEFAEPSSFSLLRILMFNKKLQLRQKVAIIQAHAKGGTIVILDGGLPQFVRDFSFFTNAGMETNFDTSALRARLLNEIKISIDYYRRQHASGNIEKLIFISSAEIQDLAQTLGNELQTPISLLKPNALFASEEEIDIGSVYALGACYKNIFPLPFKIDLAKGMSKAQDAGKKIDTVPVNFAASLKLTVGCLCVVLVTFLFSSRDASSYQQKLKYLQKQTTTFQSLTVDDIKKKQSEITNKLSQLKAIRTKSGVAFFLSRIPDLLPQGVWLKNFVVNYEDVQTRSKTNREIISVTSKVSLMLDGYVYLSDSEQQVAQVNLLILSLRNDKDLLNVFDTITLQGARKDVIDNNTVTFFQLTCN